MTPARGRRPSVPPHGTRPSRRGRSLLLSATTLTGLVLAGVAPPALATTHGGEPTFVGQPARPTVGTAVATAPADLDGDGDVDLATAADDPRHGVLWQRNEDGDGTTWTQHAVAPGAAGIAELVAVDLDGDGDTDLASLSAETLRWHRNGDAAGGGDGTQWTTTVVADSGHGVAALRAADIDGDGDADLVTAVGDTVRLHRNGDAAGGGDGTTWGERVVATGLERADDVVAADLDGDGDTDLATTELVGDRLTWHRNGGSTGGDDGTSWTAIVVSDTLAVDDWLEAGDLDGDGDTDLVTAVSGDLHLFRNDGTGTWTHVDTGSGGGGFGQVLGDIDGDGDLDLAIGFDIGAALWWWRNGDGAGGGDGTSWTIGYLEPRLADADGVAIADVDGDGDNDLVTASPRDRTVAWHDNLAGDGSTWARVDVVPSDDEPLDVETGDIDGDGDLDLVTASNWDDDTIAWNRNGDGNGGGDATDWTRVVIDERMWGAMDTAVGDIDGDGDLDVAAVSLHVGVVWFRNGDAAGGGDGTSWTRTVVDDRPYVAGYAQSVDVADIDGDGDLDLASAAQDAGSFHWHRNGDGTGGGTGDEWTSIGTGVSQALPFEVAAVDVDGDGDTDLVGSDALDDELHWFRNGDASGGGDGTSWSGVLVARAEAVSHFTAFDADGDGDRDVAAVVDGRTVLLRNGDTTGGGDSTTWTATELAGHGASDLAAADLDGDTDLDVVLAAGTTTASWLRNDDGTLGSWTVAPVAALDTLSTVAIGDLDGDTDLDLATAGYRSVTPWVHLAVDATDDGSGPELRGVTAVQPTVDTSRGSRTVGLHLRVADAGARFRGGTVELTSPSGTTVTDGGFTVADRIAGDGAEGVHQTTLVLPEGSETGTWRATRIVLTDHAGNQTVLDAEALAAAGQDVAVTVATRPAPSDTVTTDTSSGGGTGGGTGSGDTGSGGTDDGGTSGDADGTSGTDDSSTGASGSTTDDTADSTGGGTSGPTPTFVDDDGSVFESDIERLAAAGITRGCNPPTNDRFCPDDPVTRGQMAAFLTRALDLAPSASDEFRDDDTSIFEADIDALAAAGVTAGCNPPTNDRFCPDQLVRRQQMAAFLDRALGLPDAPERFVDVTSDNVFAASIGALAAADVTRGCNPPTNDRFCPTDVVTRGQMAAFLTRALDL